MKKYPVGKAQQMVLDALEIKADSFQEANQIFEELGLSVSSKRQGRTSIPSITVKDRIGGGFNIGGDGETWQQYPDADFSSIEQWIEE